MASITEDRHLPAVQPLTARSVVLTVLLGLHPPELPVNSLVRVGALFGIAERTTRVALTRMAANGDVITEDGVYRLTERLVRRQAQQEADCSPATRPWNDTWEMAVVTAESRPLVERVALRRSMVALRLAELREGVWLRPANLLRLPDDTVAEQCTFFSDVRYRDSSVLARSLWDLPAWASEARRLQRELDHAKDFKDGFMAATKVLRHLLLDPVLPPEMLPGNWPGADIRARFAQFSTEYAARLRDYCQS
ncbi:hypothetical protein NE850_00010 [Paraburkholderia sp. USG1]|uniref:PaaX family transcriptional regulator C-terminal domain-containing protein n=1 Tax=Paraburkholderia sp. USG1 TaxID=2952268 RepID=UPI002856FBE4|nr:PaaX family transcriptional regulator C-terminal domain-containing protein [Paraburkholderia sp. USG1]MDR8394710.1 hypothetical protein [Paraburkholderia sp. USG1]